jgi:hypothetical protein
MKRHLVPFVTAIALTQAATAFATHKNWVLKDDGSECTFSTPMASDDQNYGLQNWEQYPRVAYCPITLAGRWGSTGGTSGSFSPPLWADAMSGIVYGSPGWWPDDPQLSCSAQMETSNGSIYYSGTITGPWAWDKLVLAAPDTGFPNKSHWVSNGGGNDLEANEDLIPRSMWYQCQVPLFGSITGYKVRICQTAQDCTDGTGVDPDADMSYGTPDQTPLYNYVQTSGIECVPTSDRTQLHYTEDGFQNTSTTEHRNIVCPLVTPPSDSYETDRQIRYTRVYYSGGAQGSTCATDGTCPQCWVGWYNHAGSTWQADGGSSPNYFAYDPYTPGTVYQGSASGATLTIGNEVSLSVGCDLPPGVTLRGITAQASVTGVGSGT